MIHSFALAQAAPAIAQNIGENPILLQLIRNISTPLRYAKKNTFPVHKLFLKFFNPMKITETTKHIIAISEGTPLVAAV